MAITSLSAADSILARTELQGALPPSFLYGAASASYQIEGAYLEDGKSLSVWDTTLKDQDNGEIACDSYHLYPDDISLLKAFGCNVYRFSIAWTRIIPGGTRESAINEKGVAYYNKLIDALIQAGITPMATIFHFDTPQILHERYGGFLSDEIVPDFVNFAKVCFERFGDRVREWCTINEPLIYGMHSADGWNKGTWVYKRDSPKVIRSLLLCHAYTVKLYKRDFRVSQNGRIGIVLNSNWCAPVDDSPEASANAKLLLDYALGMYAGPIYCGTFPETCLKEFGSSAPVFTEPEWSIVKDSSDFFGLNSYSTSYAIDRRISETEASPRGWTFGRIQQTWEKDGKIIGNRGQDNFPYDVPWGFRNLLRHVHQNYTSTRNIPIIITENGFAVQDECLRPITQIVADVERQAYYARYLTELFEAIVDDNINIGGYIAWSLTDNIEWFAGWKSRFGLAAIDRENGLKRIPKDSGHMLRIIFDGAISNIPANAKDFNKRL